MIKHLLLAALALPLAVFADSCTRIPVEIHDAYAFTTQDDEALGAYATLTNRDRTSHTVTGVSSSIQGPRTVLFQAYAHNSENDNILSGNMEEIVIPPHGAYMFRPGKTHITLSGYKIRPNPGDTIDLTFTFADGCSATINDVMVKDPSGDY